MILPPLVSSQVISAAWNITSWTVECGEEVMLTSGPRDPKNNEAGEKKEENVEEVSR